MYLYNGLQLLFAFNAPSQSLFHWFLVVLKTNQASWILSSLYTMATIHRLFSVVFLVLLALGV